MSNQDPTKIDIKYAHAKGEDVPVKRVMGGSALNGAQIELSAENVGLSFSELLASADTAMNHGEYLQGSKADSFYGNNSIASLETDGIIQELNTVLILAASRVVGIVCTHKDGQVTGVRLVEVPVMGTGLDAPRTIAELDTTELDQPGDDGVIQPWRSFNIGRTSFAKSDSQVSREHLKVVLTKTKGIVSDISTYGTALVNGRSAEQAKLMQTFIENPELWAGVETVQD